MNLKPNTNTCFRCHTPGLKEIRKDGDYTLFECADCGRRYCQNGSSGLLDAWPSPLAVALYAVIFDQNPSGRASELAQELLKTQESMAIDSIISDIDSEIATPAQTIKDIHNSRASEKELRKYLAQLSTHLKAQRNN